MTFLHHLSGLLATSACAWLVYGFYICIRIELFIVKRYEQETDLLDTVYFREHATFVQYIPNFISSAMYTSHLLTFIWGWRYFKKRKPYRDIKDAGEVTRHFSKRELRQAKWFAISGLIIVIHGVLYYIFLYIWPEAFG